MSEAMTPASLSDLIAEISTSQFTNELMAENADGCSVAAIAGALRIANQNCTKLLDALQASQPAQSTADYRAEAEKLAAEYGDDNLRGTAGNCPVTRAIEQALVAAHNAGLASQPCGAAGDVTRAAFTVCSDCPPERYPSDKTRCIACPHRLVIGEYDLLREKAAREIYSEVYGASGDFDADTDLREASYDGADAILALLRSQPTAQGMCNDCPPVGYSTNKTRCLECPRAVRPLRQQEVQQFCSEAFGDDQAYSIPQRGLRLLEEAIEADQSAGGTREQAHKLVDYVFDRPVGALNQELGGVGITILALAAAAGLDADAEEQRELERIKSKPRSHFTARNQAKNAAGFLAQPGKGEGNG